MIPTQPARSHNLLLFGLACLFVLAGCTAVKAAEPATSFIRDIAPLLKAHCLKCHSGARAKGELDLTSRDRLLAGGDSGSVLTPGKAAESLLFEHVRDKKMPPRKPLSAAQIELLRRWIDAGAVWQGPALTPPRIEVNRAGRDWWSLQPIRRPALPAVSRADWIRTPLDAFILARLDKQGLAPSPETDRRTYIRRLTLDLTGLLPEPQEIDAFIKDTSADAYEKLVDRLLASPAYGERWARHWLDVVRFAESHGYEMNTLRPNAWPYRDYTIRAFNRDTPYPQFMREQLAGDALAESDFLSRSATGFLVAGPHDMVGNATREGQLQQRMDDLFDMVSTTGTTFLGLTVGCARCHDHKFDPIAQKDFYSLQAVLAGVQHAERDILVPNGEERHREIATLRAERAGLERRIDALEPLAKAPGSSPIRPPVQPRRNVERFAVVEARFVRFTVAATIDRSEPCIDELELYGPDAGAGNLALASRGARATASSVYPNNPLHRIEHINDGRLGNGRSWISRQPGKGWIRIELPKTVVLERIVWGRDRERKYRDRLPRDYRIEVSTDGHSWKAVAGSWDRHPPGHAVAPPDDVTKLRDEYRRLDERLRSLEKPMRIYAGTFSTPQRTHILKRGDPLQQLDEVQPSPPSRIGPRFALKPSATEAERR
ncbi:MAG: DUF1549 domain-containing protein, partial [Gemmataceae bacterium]